MLWSKNSVSRSLPELRHLRDEDRHRLWKQIERARWRIGWFPAIVGLAAWITWIIATCMLPNLLLDYSEGFEPVDLGWIGTVLVVLGSLGIATALAVCAGSVVQARLMYRHMARELMAGRCLWCGYCLTGLENEGGRLCCPECGEQSPVRSDTE